MIFGEEIGSSCHASWECEAQGQYVSRVSGSLCYAVIDVCERDPELQSLLGVNQILNERQGTANWGSF